MVQTGTLFRRKVLFRLKSTFSFSIQANRLPCVSIEIIRNKTKMMCINSTNSLIFITNKITQPLSNGYAKRPKRPRKFLFKKHFYSDHPAGRGNKNSASKQKKHGNKAKDIAPAVRKYGFELETGPTQPTILQHLTTLRLDAYHEPLISLRNILRMSPPFARHGSRAAQK